MLEHGVGQRELARKSQRGDGRRCELLADRAHVEDGDRSDGHAVLEGGEPEALAVERGAVANYTDGAAGAVAAHLGREQRVGLSISRSVSGRCHGSSRGDCDGGSACVACQLLQSSYDAGVAHGRVAGCVESGCAESRFAVAMDSGVL